MDIKDLPQNKPDLDELKDRLTEYCDVHEIKKFDPEEIIELIEDGEDIDWIIGQLKDENNDLDTGEIDALLSGIESLIAPDIVEEGTGILSPDELVESVDQVKFDDLTYTGPAEEEVEEEEELPDISDFDLSQLDDLPLPPGMELPKGLDMNQIKKMMETPQGAMLTDFSLFCQERGIEDIQSTFSDSQKMKELNDEYMETPREAFDGKTPAEIFGEDQTFMPQKVETYRREEPRVGRNDPCPCGSGKKYKKCCGRGK